MIINQTHGPKLAAIDNSLAQKYSLSRGALVVTALLSIGKLAKAGKLGTAGTKVMQSIETGVKQFKNTVKYLEAVVGQKVKSYGWNEADLAYETKLADGSTRFVSKADLEGSVSGGSNSNDFTSGAEISDIVKGISKVSLDRVKARLLGLSDRTYEIRSVKVFGSRTTGLSSHTGEAFTEASDVDMVVLIDNAKEFRSDPRIFEFLNEIEADFKTETGVDLDLNVYSPYDIGGKTIFSSSDLIDF